jgi:hypothetical protein
MFRSKQRSALSVLAVVALVAFAACSNGTQISPSPTWGQAGSGTQPINSDGAGTGLRGASAALTLLNNYEFTESLGGDAVTALQSLPMFDISGSQTVYSMSGTVVNRPQKAADLRIGSLHFIEIGGFDYADGSGSGGFLKFAVSGASRTDPLMPAMHLSMVITDSTADNYTNVATEMKNEVMANHYQASPQAMAQFGSTIGLTGVTWTGDIWVAQYGGYPVSMAIVARAPDNGIAYEVLFDITNVNNPTNMVKAPTNIVAA